jgi:hypothetical protein
MRKGFYIVQFLAVLTLVLAICSGCDKKQTSPDKEKIIQSVLAEKLKCDRLRTKMGVDKEYPVYFQEPLKGIRGEVHGSFSGSRYYSAGSIDGSIENATSVTICWKDWRKRLRKISVPERKFEFIVREKKPASVKFELSLPRYTEEEIREILQTDNITPAAMSSESTCRNLADSIISNMSIWDSFEEAPGRYMDDYLISATLYASSADMRKYHGIVVPKGQ